MSKRLINQNKFSIADEMRSIMTVNPRICKDPELLRDVVNKLLAGEPLEARYRAHRLSGDMAGYWECHIEFDWLLVWEDDGEIITLQRTGTHSDIFRPR